MCIENQRDRGAYILGSRNLKMQTDREAAANILPPKVGCLAEGRRFLGRKGIWWQVSCGGG
jgi:hypothetical protein